MPACTSVSDYFNPTQKQERLEEEQAEQVVNTFRQKMMQMVSARILVNAHPYEGNFIMPAAEFAILRDILSRTETVPMAHGENVVVYVSYPSFQTLVLKDAEGRIYDLPMLDQLWMRKSQAQALLPTRPRCSNEPRWCLPDEDYAALQTLPTVRQARAWGRLYSPGKTALIMPNGAPSPAAAEQVSPAAAPAGVPAAAPTAVAPAPAP